MKRWIARFLIVILVLTCAACGKNREPGRPAAPPPAPSASQQAERREEAKPSAPPDTAGQTAEALVPPEDTTMPTASPPLQLPAPAAGEPEAKETEEKEPEAKEPAGKETEAKERDDSPQQAPGETAPPPVDLDLTVFSGTMVYAEVFNMISAPENYIGKTIRMRGVFSTYQDPDTQKIYCGVIVQDATACCAQGFDVTMPFRFRYPEDYPAAQSEVTVVGTIQADRTLEDHGILTLRLENIRFE